jgi:hypothetical protein
MHYIAHVCSKQLQEAGRSAPRVEVNRRRAWPTNPFDCLPLQDKAPDNTAKNIDKAFIAEQHRPLAAAQATL